MIKTLTILGKKIDVDICPPGHDPGCSGFSAYSARVYTNKLPDGSRNYFCLSVRTTVVEILADLKYREANPSGTVMAIIEWIDNGQKD